MNFIEDLRTSIGEKERLLRVSVKQLTESLHIMHRLTAHIDSLLNMESYCVSASLIEQSGEVSEHAVAKDVCVDKERALTLFCAISHGEVTPCTLFDVLSDMIG
jgi:hypothetical protein